MMYGMRFMNFTNRIQEVYGFSSELAEYHAKKILENLPRVLAPNIDEWCERNQKLSDIYVGKYTVPMIMQLWGNDDFLSAVQVLIEYERNPDEGERLIWRMRR